MLTIRKEAHEFYKRLGYSIIKPQYAFRKKSSRGDPAYGGYPPRALVGAGLCARPGQAPSRRLGRGQAVAWATLPLQKEHAVAVAIKSVAFVDGVAIGLKNQFSTRESADQNQQCGPREMEIGE